MRGSIARLFVGALVAATAGLVTQPSLADDVPAACERDLDCRVARLEAVAGRRSDRPSSVTLWGYVNRAVLAWNDGLDRNAALGIDSSRQTTRFGVRGSVRAAPSLETGYAIVVGIDAGGRASAVNQFRDKTGSLSGETNPPSGFGANDYALELREANWWVENRDLGRLTVGRFSRGDGNNLVATMVPSSIGVLFRTGSSSTAPAKAGVGSFSSMTVSSVVGPTSESDERKTGLRWTSPKLGGFTLGAAIGGSLWRDDLCQTPSCSATQGYGPATGAYLKFADVLGGVKVALAVSGDRALSTSSVPSRRPDSTSLSTAAAMLHVDSGLFAQGHVVWFTRGHDAFDAAGAPINQATPDDSATQRLVQAGISRNWSGLGTTVVFGEALQTRNGYNVFSGFTGAAAGSNAVVSAGGSGINYWGDRTTAAMRGLGLVQHLDAAAMDLYANIRRYDVSSANCTSAGGCKPIGVLVSGARIRF